MLELKNKQELYAIFVLITIFFWTGSVSATPVPILSNDVNIDGYFYSGGSSSYIGPGFEATYANIYAGGQGNVPNGLWDAYDGMGLITGFNGLTVQRRTETFVGLNMFRWFDTYTNNTSSTIDTTQLFFGDLGSDTTTATFINNFYLTGTSDAGPSDPVIAHIYGNNDFAVNSMVATVGGPMPGDGVPVSEESYLPDNFTISAELSLDPGESISLLYMNVLVADDTDRSGDVALATSLGNDYVNNPYLEGLSADERGRIINFGALSTPDPIPEPATMLLLGSGLVGLAGFRRKKKK